MKQHGRFFPLPIDDEDEPRRAAVETAGPRGIPEEPEALEIPEIDPQPGAPMAGPPAREWGDRIQPQDVIGPYDAWLGKVESVEYAGTGTPATGYNQEIFVRRAGAHWTTNNEPDAYEVPLVACQPGSTGIPALPFPLRHDQATYHVSVGDYVTVLTGRDGRAFYLCDELPFLAWVVKSGSSAKEDNTGGAGLLALKVRRRLLTGDPSSASMSDFTDLEDAESADVEYTNVLLCAPKGVQHGYRCGDPVWVERRGDYLFAWPLRQSFLAKVVTAGPDSEADFSTNHYWVREQDITVAYSDNSWTWTLANRTQTDPTGSGGRYGRWVDAVYPTENATSHALLAENDVVLIHAEADPSTGEACYIIAGGGGFLPDGSGEHKVLQLDASDVPIWDYVMGWDTA